MPAVRAQGQRIDARDRSRAEAAHKDAGKSAPPRETSHLSASPSARGVHGDEQQIGLTGEISRGCFLAWLRGRKMNEAVGEIDRRRRERRPAASAARQTRLRETIL